MGLQLLTPPAVEPVSLDELKTFLRMDVGDTSQDDTITSLAIAGRYFAETFTRRRFVTQQWRLLMDYFPGYIDMKLAGAKVSSPFVSGSNAVLVGIRYAVLLPFPPVRSIDLFQYLDANGNSTVLNPQSNASPPADGEYVADIVSNPARLMPPFGRMWPVARVIANAVQVDYTVGYGGPVTVTMTAGQKAISGHIFSAGDIGRPISIPGAGPDGGTLNTFVDSVGPSGNGTARDAASTAVNGVTAILVNNPNANPGHWELIRNAIKLWVNGRYSQRLPDQDIQENVESLLWPVRDIRK
ncbi:MAG TPA: hypothetical protein VNO24_00505 [Blastocatellia bacterium]|nr:hypothetical protein [Blastocatellia bacterium]